MDQRTVDEVAVESRSPEAQPRPGPCTFCGDLGDTQCAEEGCLAWCHYDPCYTRFCDASEFYPGLDPNPLRRWSMVTFCYGCALMYRAESRRDEGIREAEARSRRELAEAAQEYHDNYDSETTQDPEYDPEYDSEATQYLDEDMIG